MNIGKSIRLERIINRNTGNTVIIPMDHGISMEILWLHREGTRPGFQLRPVDGGCEGARKEIEITIPDLRLPPAGTLTGEVAAQGGIVDLQDTRDETGAGWQGDIFKNLLTPGEIDDLFHLERFQVDDAHR